METDFDMDISEAPVKRKSNIKAALAGKAAKASAKEAADKAVSKARGRFASKNTDAEKPAPTRTPIPRTQVPDDFKPAFYVFTFALGEDGMVDPTTWSVTRIQGRLENKEAKRNDLNTFDLCTSYGLISRLSAVIYQTNIDKRLALMPAGREYVVTCRAAKRSADNTISFLVKMLQYRNKKGKLVPIEDKADPAYRRIRRVARLGASAFVAATLPPRAKAGRKVKKDEEELMGEDD